MFSLIWVVKVRLLEAVYFTSPTEKKECFFPPQTMTNPTTKKEGALPAIVVKAAVSLLEKMSDGFRPAVASCRVTIK